MATHRNQNRLLLATVGLVVVGAILAGVVIQGRSGTNDQAAELVTSTTSPSGSTTPSTATTTPSVSSNGSILPEQVVVQPEVQVTIDAGDIAPVILKLAVTPVGTDEERIEQVRAARNKLLAQLPAGSWTGTDNAGTLPYIALSLDAAGFEATRNSGVVSMINDDEQLFVSASSLEPSSTVSPSSINSTATMGATAAWAAGWKGAGSTVAVIDTGVQTDHPYLVRGSTKKTIAEACFSSSCPPDAVMTPTSNPIVGAAKPCSGAVGCDHGTHVAGIAVGGNGSSIPSGVAPEANLIAINVFYEYQVGLVPMISASTSSIDNALSWLYNKRALFPGLVSVNLSLGGSTKYTTYCDSSNSSTKSFIDLLLTVGITTVIASGNDRWADGVSAPGCISTAVTVGAVDGVPDVSTYYSNDGPQVDLMAPGSNITSSILGSQMGLLSGTSMATPAVAGAFAVLHMATPALTLARLRSTGYVVSASGYSIPSIRLYDAVPSTGSSTFNSVSPVRLSDTRAQVAGGATVDSQQVGKGKLGGGGVSVIPIAGRGGVPQTGAGAVALNVTVVSPSVGGFLTVYPSGSSRPNASNINFVAGAIVPNMVIAKLGADGSIAVFNSGGWVDVAIDVVGWFPVSAGYGPLDPARIVETRSVPGYTTVDGQLQG
ncbi:MAG: S8 family serine peptidase, partial [Actinobacteria bacterium]|nr:S8 family serine peptidase [Actinomycetota bacterium]